MNVIGLLAISTHKRWRSPGGPSSDFHHTALEFFCLLPELFEPKNPTALPKGTGAPKDLRSV